MDIVSGRELERGQALRALLAPWLIPDAVSRQLASNRLLPRGRGTTPSAGHSREIDNPGHNFWTFCPAGAWTEEYQFARWLPPW
jgi:hypothetical protein